MNEIILLKLGELVLKGGNRHNFEDKLMSNIRRRLKSYGEFKVYSRQSITYVEPLNEFCDMVGAWEAMKKLFGVVGLNLARSCEKDPDDIVRVAKEYLGDQLQQAHTFKVESRRADKTFPMNSIELSQYVGGELQDAYPHLKADMNDPELTITVEIRDYAAYVHGDPEPGAGGLPVGMSGRGVCLLSGGIDSPVAAWMMAKRGLALDMVHFYSPPYTSPQSREKVLELSSLLAPWLGGHMVHIVPFTHIQEEIRRECPEELFTVIMRRFMMRVAQRVADRIRAGALILGESLGQVASQTIEAMTCTETVASKPVFRPLIGLDKEEVIRQARRIGTFETSILPYEDCCTVFTPKHPRIRPGLEEVARAEQVLNVVELVDEAVKGIQRVQISITGEIKEIKE